MRRQGRLNWSDYRAGDDNGFIAAVHRWVFHVNEQHPGTDAPRIAFAVGSLSSACKRGATSRKVLPNCP